MTEPAASSAPFLTTDLSRAVEAGQHADPSNEARNLVLLAAERDLFFVATVICGFSRLDPLRHRAPCEFIQRISQTPMAVGLYEDPRGVGKSSIATVSNPIQIIISPPLPGTPWAGADTTFVIASKKKERASAFLSLIKEHWERNELLRWARPDIRPDIGKKWATDAASLIRPNMSADVTYLTAGTDTGQTGAHAHQWRGDDFIDDTNWFSPTEINRARDFIRASQGVVQPHYGSRLITENQWALFDVNHWLKNPEEYPREERFEARVDVFSRGLTSCDDCINGRAQLPDGRPAPHAHEPPIYPLLRWQPGDKATPPKPFTMESIEELRKQWGSRMYSAQGENDPLDPTMLKLRDEWLHRYHLEKDERKRTAIIHFRAPEMREPAAVDVRTLYRVMMFDPGHNPQAKGACRTACVAAAFHEPTGIFFELESWAAKLEPLDGITKAIETYIRWAPNRVGVERIGFQRIIGPLMIRELRERWGITGLTSGPEGDPEHNIWLMGAPGDKDARIEGALEPLGNTGRMYVRTEAHQLIEEWRKFPMWTYKDILDCLAMLPRMLTGRYKVDPAKRSAQLENSRRRRARMFAGRDTITGYMVNWVLIGASCLLQLA